MKKIEITARLPLLTDRLTNINADLVGMIGGRGGAYKIIRDLS